MTRRSAFTSHLLLQAKWLLLVLALCSVGYVPAAGQAWLVQGDAGCHGANSPAPSVRFEPIRHEISTTTLLGSQMAELRWALSSEVTVEGPTELHEVRYCYAYFFKNVGKDAVKVSLVSPRLAMSPLFEIMQDFSLVLAPGATETIRFSTDSAPKLSLATAYNSARDERVAKWQFVSSGPVSLYLPVVVQASYKADE